MPTSSTKLYNHLFNGNFGAMKIVLAKVLAKHRCQGFQLLILML